MKKELHLSAIIIILLLGLAFCTTKNTVSISNNSETQKSYEKTNRSNIVLTAHEPIYIDSNEDFETYNFTGVGTELHPYIIANLNITTTIELAGIWIQDTTVYFEIRNCTIITDVFCITIKNMAPRTGKVINNFFQSRSKMGVGVWIIHTSEIIIAENEFVDFREGIRISYSYYNLVTNNWIKNCEYLGLSLHFSGFNEITYNYIQNSRQYGLIITSTSHMNRIHHNAFIDNAQIEQYSFDDGKTGTIRSQGYDDGVNNYWYDEDSKYGNKWSDYIGEDTYSIDGSANAVDLYPLEATSSLSIGIPILTFFLSIIFISIYSTKWKNERKLK